MLTRSAKPLSKNWRILFSYSKQKNISNSSIHIASHTHHTPKILASTARSLLLSSLLIIVLAGITLLKPENSDQIQVLPLSADIAALAAPSMATAYKASSDIRASTNLTTHNTADSVHVTQMNTLSKNAPQPKERSQQQQWVTNWLSKRYRVASDATNLFVATAYTTAHETKLDPLLILAVMAIESGLNPFAESPVGAQGLMQVMSKIHEEKFDNLGGIKAALNPTANIKVGSLILKDYVTQGGSIEAGLKRYVGAAAFADDNGYGNKVLAEYRRLQDVANGKHVPLFKNPIVIAPQLPQIQAETSESSPVINIL